jgi:hypothetical protein
MCLRFDPAKSERNSRLRGLPFEDVAHFDFDTASVIVDGRQDCGETRYVAMGRLNGRVAVLSRDRGWHPRHQLPQGQCPRGQPL